MCKWNKCHKIYKGQEFRILLQSTCIIHRSAIVLLKDNSCKYKLESQGQAQK